MFKGKIYVYENVNGQEKKIEKEFNNPSEYYDFLNKNEEVNLLSSGLDEYLNNFFNSRFALEPSEEENRIENKQNLLPEGVNLNEYEKEAKKIDEEKNKKEEEKGILEKSLEKLKGFLEKFKKEQKEDLVEKVKKDIKKVEEKLKKLVS